MPLLAVLLTGALLTGPGAPEAPAGATPPAAADTAPSVPDDDDGWLRAAGVGATTTCASCACGAVPTSLLGVLVYEGARGGDPLGGYATGLFCGLGLCALPVAVTGGAACASAAGADLLAGDELSLARVSFAAAGAAAVALGAGMLSLVVAYPVGLLVVESGARDAARLVYGGVPLVVLGLASLLAGGVAGGLYGVFTVEPEGE